jgi:hypothetical protein
MAGDEILQNRATRIVQIQSSPLQADLLPASDENSANGVVEPNVTLGANWRGLLA